MVWEGCAHVDRICSHELYEIVLDAHRDERRRRAARDESPPPTSDARAEAPLARSEAAVASASHATNAFEREFLYLTRGAGGGGGVNVRWLGK